MSIRLLQMAAPLASQTLTNDTFHSAHIFTRPTNDTSPKFSLSPIFTRPKFSLSPEFHSVHQESTCYQICQSQFWDNSFQMTPTKVVWRSQSSWWSKSKWVSFEKFLIGLSESLHMRYCFLLQDVWPPSTNYSKEWKCLWKIFRFSPLNISFQFAIYSHRFAI